MKLCSYNKIKFFFFTEWSTRKTSKNEYRLRICRYILCFNTCYFGYGESKTNRRIGKGHDCCQNREPRELVEVWYLTQYYLDCCKYYHEWVVWYWALGIVPVFVETIWPFHSPESCKRKQIYLVKINNNSSWFLNIAH